MPVAQGMFAGAVSDNFGERIEQKIFHAEIVVDLAKAPAKMKQYKKIPVIAEFADKDGRDILRETIDGNCRRGEAGDYRPCRKRDGTHQGRPGTEQVIG